AIAVSLSIQTGTVPDLVSPAPSAEGAGWLVLAATPPGEGTRVVDELCEARRQIRLELRCLIRGDPAGLLGGVDLAGGVGDERGDLLLLGRDKCGDEPVARLPVRDRHIGEALVRSELGPELRLGDPDVCRGRGEVRAFSGQAVAEDLAAGLVPDLRDQPLCA